MLFLYMSLIDSDDERDKFEQLYLKYRKLMKYIALNILGDEQLSEDAVHNAFLKIINHLDKFSDINCQETKNLIVIIVRSVSIDMYRKRNREFDKTDILDKELSAETDFSAFQTEYIVKEIEALPEIYRDILLIKIEYDYTDREIAKILGIKADTASKRLERARKLLKRQLFKENCYNEKP